MFLLVDMNEPMPEVISVFQTEQEAITEANQFYHDTFNMEDDYDEDFQLYSVEEANELYRGSNYEIFKEVTEYKYGNS